MCLPSEEIHCQLKPNVEITLPSKEEQRNHIPPLHVSTEVNKKMTLPWWNGKMHKWENGKKNYIQIITNTNILQQLTKKATHNTDATQMMEA